MTAYTLTAAYGSATLTGKASLRGLVGPAAFGTFAVSRLSSNYAADQAVAEGVRINAYGGLAADLALLLSEGLGIAAAAPTYAYAAGGLISENVRVSLVDAAAYIYGLTLSDSVRVNADMTPREFATLAETVGVAPALSVVAAALVLDRLYAGSSLTGSSVRLVSLASAVAASDALAFFLGVDLSDTMGVAPSLTTLKIVSDTLAETAGIAPVLGETLLLNVEVDDAVDLTHTSLLQMIYAGDPLLDGVQISAAYVAPNNDVTTWVINTRTSAATEYRNWDFNSFATVGSAFLGASSTGLYELDGQTDDGTNIIPLIRSGIMSLGQSQFTSFRGAYLGMRTSGDYILRLIAGDGRTYHYGLRTLDMRTTKVRFAKGLRSRYFAFELEGTGSDFDLEAIEFIPIIAQRRV